MERRELCFVLFCFPKETDDIVHTRGKKKFWSPWWLSRAAVQRSSQPSDARYTGRRTCELESRASLVPNRAPSLRLPALGTRRLWRRAQGAPRLFPCLFKRLDTLLARASRLRFEHHENRRLINKRFRRRSSSWLGAVLTEVEPAPALVFVSPPSLYLPLSLPLSLMCIP